MNNIVNTMNAVPPLKDPNEILQDIKRIIEKMKDLYEDSSQKQDIKIEIITERCRSELCPLDHTMVNISADFMFGIELLAICRYLKRNNLPFYYIEHSLKVILN